VPQTERPPSLFFANDLRGCLAAATDAALDSIRSPDFFNTVSGDFLVSCRGFFPVICIHCSQRIPMWFKNLFIYRLPPNAKIDSQSLEAKLAQKPLQQCGSQDMQSRGWVPPHGNEGPLVQAVNQQLLIALGAEQKLLPASIINRFTKDRIAETEEQQGYPVGRKQKREIKENVTQELLPRAFSSRRMTRAWIDPKNGWLVVDTSSQGKAEEVLDLLVKTTDATKDFPVKLLRTQMSSSGAMTGWLAGGESPAGFTIDRDLELTSGDEGKVRYVKHNLEGDEIRAHIADGKAVTRLGMTWNDRVSFVLGEQMQVKRLTFLDVLKEEAEKQADSGVSADEMFAIDFALMTGELAQLLDDLVVAHGGEEAIAS
jgi:recombination associated protein RdgC